MPYVHALPVSRWLQTNLALGIADPVLALIMGGKTAKVAKEADTVAKGLADKSTFLVRAYGFYTL